MNGTSVDTPHTNDKESHGNEGRLRGSGGLGTRDYILIGVYTVLYFLLISIAALLTHAIPAGLPFMGFACGVFGGTAYMLVMMKSRHFGAVTIMGILLSITMGVIHGNYYTVATAIVAGLCADLIARSGHYRGMTSAWISAGVFNLWNIGMFLPFYIGRNSYLASLASQHGAGYADQLAGLFPGWMLPVLVVLGIIGGILGAMIARALMRRQFTRAGLV